MALTESVGGSEFVDGVFSGRVNGTVSPGSPITLSPSAGKRVRLDRLSSTGADSAISITVGERLLVDSKTVVKISTNNPGDFAITGGESGDGHGFTDLNRWAGCRGSIAGQVDESIVIESSATVGLAYSFTESA